MVRLALAGFFVCCETGVTIPNTWLSEIDFSIEMDAFDKLDDLYSIPNDRQYQKKGQIPMKDSSRINKPPASKTPKTLLSS